MSTKSNIALIGGRATGKTTAAKLLGDKLDMEVRETDAIIVQNANQPIPDLVEQYGWQHCRDLEYRALQQAVISENTIIDCGGGIVCDQDEANRQFFSERKVDLLKDRCTVVWLFADIAEQLKRMGSDENRPSISGQKSASKEMQEIMDLRRPWYEQASDFRIDTTGISSQEVVDQITQILDNKGR